MNNIPIVFAFDNNLILQAAVCLSSLFINANKNTIYNVYIVHSAEVNLEKSFIERVSEKWPQHRISYVTVQNTFNNAFEIRDVTIATYYRLLLPDLIKKHHKVIYSDVDFIFRTDLSEIFNIDLGDNYVAATYDWGMLLTKDGKRYLDSIPQLSNTNYIQAGFILMNLEQMRKDNLVRKFKAEVSANKYKFQDQDILNIVCSNKHILINPKWNLTDYAMLYLNKDPHAIEKYFEDLDLKNIFSIGSLHYNGHKPWKKYAVNFDIWWEYYRKSPVFDQKFYFNFFYNKLDELDTLSLWKRIKILIRFFKNGRKTIS